MALTRKFLSAMGIEADKIEEIITAHVEVTDTLKDEKEELQKQVDSLKADAEKVPDLEKKIKELEANDVSKEYEKKKDELKKLQKEYDEYKESIKNDGIKKAKAEAYRGILKEAGVSEKRIDAIMKLSNDEVESLELGEDNKVSDDNKKALIEGIKENWSDFITTVKKVGADVDNPPTGGKPNEGRTSKAAQIAQKYHDNLYGSDNKEE